MIDFFEFALGLALGRGRLLSWVGWAGLDWAWRRGAQWGTGRVEDWGRKGYKDTKYWENRARLVMC